MSANPKALAENSHWVESDAAGIKTNGSSASGFRTGCLGTFLSLGWLTPKRVWQSATGWSQIPSYQRPPLLQPLWEPTPEDPPPNLHWLGHAGFLLDWQGTRLLIDPNTNPRCTIVRGLLAGVPSPEALSSSVGQANGVLISHAHLDHLDHPTLSRLRCQRLLAPRTCAGALRALNKQGRPAELCREGDRKILGNLEVIATPARHGGGRMHPLRRAAPDGSSAALGWLVRRIDRPDSALYFAGDTALGSHFETIAAQLRPRVAILPIGAYLPRWPLKHFHLSPKEAVFAASILGVETTIPCHFGTFPLALDPPDRALPQFAAAATQLGLQWQMPRLLEAHNLQMLKR